MQRDGRYAAWFRTPRGEGTGIVHLANGRISGGDATFTYGGSYQLDEDRFTAVLTTHRYADGPFTTVFGCDEVEAQLTGTFSGNRAVCSGTAKQAPGVLFEATLFLQQQEQARAGGGTAAGRRAVGRRLGQRPKNHGNARGCDEAAEAPRPPHGHRDPAFQLIGPQSRWHLGPFRRTIAHARSAARSMQPEGGTHVCRHPSRQGEVW